MQIYGPVEPCDAFSPPNAHTVQTCAPALAHEPDAQILHPTVPPVDTHVPFTAERASVTMGPE